MPDYKINVIVNPTRTVTGAQRVRRELRGINTEAARTNQLLSRAFTVASIVFAVTHLTRMVDTYVTLQNRLRVVTHDTAQLSATTNELFKIAERTRTSFEATAQLYTRISLSAKSLGSEQKDLLQIIESINQAVIISGASTREANAALIQLSQGIASNTLRGDELRSVLEQIPFVADVIAAYLDVNQALVGLDETARVTRGTLRELGSQGKITADIVISAFRALRGEVAEEFAKTVSTLGQSIIFLKNETIRLLGELDRGLTVTQSIGSVFRILGNNIELVAAALISAGAAFTALALPTILRQLTRLGTVAAVASLKLSGLFAIGGAATFATLLAQAAANGTTLAQEFDSLVANVTTFTDSFVINERTLGALNEINNAVSELYLQGESREGILSGIDLLDLDEVNEAIKRLSRSYEILQGAQFRAELVEGLGLESPLDSINAVLTSLEERLERLRARKNELTEIRPSVREDPEALKAQRNLLRSIRGPIEDYLRDMEALDTIYRKAQISGLEFSRALRDIQIEFLNSQTDFASGVERAFLKMRRDAEDTASQIERAITDSASAAGDAFAEFVATGRFDFTRLADSIIADLARIAIQTSIVRPLAGILLGAAQTFLPGAAGALPGPGPTTTVGPQALGGVFSGGVEKFQKGGIFNSPLLFGRAGNKLGVLGEAGPEAILPVSRGRGGRLGVDASGVSSGDVIVQVFDQRSLSDAEPVETEERTVDGQRILGIMIRDTVRQGLRNGEYDAAMRGRFGQAPNTIRRS